MYISNFFNYSSKVRKLDNFFQFFLYNQILFKFYFDRNFINFFKRCINYLRGIFDCLQMPGYPEKILEALNLTPLKSYHNKFNVTNEVPFFSISDGMLYLEARRRFDGFLSRQHKISQWCCMKFQHICSMKCAFKWKN